MDHGIHCETILAARAMFFFPLLSSAVMYGPNNARFSFILRTYRSVSACSILLLITPSKRCVRRRLRLCECDCFALATPPELATPIFFLQLEGWFLVVVSRLCWFPSILRWVQPVLGGAAESVGGYSIALAVGLWASPPPSMLPTHKWIWEAYSCRSRLLAGKFVCVRELVVFICVRFHAFFIRALALWMCIFHILHQTSCLLASMVRSCW